LTVFELKFSVMFEDLHLAQIQVDFCLDTFLIQRANFWCVIFIVRPETGK